MTNMLLDINAYIGKLWSIFVKLFWTLLHPKGYYVITPIRPSVGPLISRSVFKYLRDRSLVFSDFLHEIKAP